MSQEAAKRFFDYILTCMKDGQDYSQIAKNLTEKDMPPDEVKNMEENVKTVYTTYYERAQKEEFSASSIPGAFLLAAITAFLGAAVWAGVSVFGQVEIGILAWGLGYIIGMAVLQGAAGRKGVFLQMMAVIFSLLSIIGGKYMAFAYVAIGSVAKEHGAAVANKLGPLSFRVISSFVLSIPEIMSVYDGLWIFLAVASAWAILEPLGLDLNRLKVPPGTDDTKGNGLESETAAPDAASLRAAFPGFRPTTREPNFSKGPLFNIGLFKARNKHEETGAYVMTRYCAILGMPLWPLDGHVVIDTAEGKQKTMGTVPLEFSARLGTWVATAFALVVAFSITAVTFLLYMFSSSFEPNELLLEARRLNKASQYSKAAQSLSIAALTDEYSKEEATDELHSMVYQKLTAYPLKEAAGVLKAMFYLKRELGEIEKYQEPLVEIGLSLVKTNKDKDPQGALKVLNVLGSFKPLDKTITDVKAKLCKDALKRNPDDLLLLNGLGEVLLGQDKNKEAIELLEPHASRLGSGLAARTLGMAFAKEQQVEKAIPLLQRYIDVAIPKHIKVRKRHGKHFLQPFKDQIKILSSGLADDFNYDALKKADPATQRATIIGYARYKVMQSPHAHLAQIDYDEQSDVVPVAVFLATIRANRAKLLNGRQRKKELTRADYLLTEVEPDVKGETHFKAIRARVFHMLGKRKEAFAILEKMDKEDVRDFGSLSTLAALWLEFDKKKRAAPIAKEAYELAKTDDEKSVAAGLRAEAAFDTNDKVRWMSQCKQKEGLFPIKFELIKGQQALENGDYEKARAIFKKVVDSSTEFTKEKKELLGGYATAAFALYGMSGSIKDLENVISFFDLAHKVSPEDHTLDGLQGNVLLLRAVHKTVGDEIDFEKLKLVARLDHLDVLFKTKSQRLSLISKLTSNSDFQKAIELFKSALDRNPADPNCYDNLLEVYCFTRDRKALDGLLKRLEKQKLNLDGLIENGKPELEEKRIKSVMGLRQKIAKDNKELIRADGLTLPTYCLAVQQIIGSTDSDSYLHSSSLADDNVHLARRAYEKVGITATDALVNALLERAVYTINLTYPKLGDTVKKCRRMELGALLAMATARDEKLRDAIKENKDIKRALELIDNKRQEFPWYVMAWEWALMRNIDKAKADEIEEQLMDDEILWLSSPINEKTSPMSRNVAARGFYLRLLKGETKNAINFLRTYRRRGLYLPATK